MTKTEEALCNGITFSVPRLVPSSIQEGELENALYYVYAVITPLLDKLVLKIYDAPSCKAVKIKGKEVESITLDLEKNVSDEELDRTRFDSYQFGDIRDGMGHYHPEDTWIDCNIECAYNGLMLYPGLKCVIIETIKSIIKLNEQKSDEDE